MSLQAKVALGSGVSPRAWLESLLVSCDCFPLTCTVTPFAALQVTLAEEAPLNTVQAPTVMVEGGIEVAPLQAVSVGS